MKFFHSKWSSCFFAAFILILTLTGCGKDDDNPVDQNNNQNPGVGSASIVLNGGGYTNKTVNFSVAGAEYDPSGSETIVVFTAGTDTITGGLVFHGSSTGTYNLSIDTDTDPINGIYLVIGSSKYYVSTTTGSIKITQYGNIGGAIKGTFDGTLYDVQSPTTPVTISGSFTALRGPDTD